METRLIKKGWWLNVTVMARYQDQYIVVTRFKCDYN